MPQKHSSAEAQLGLPEYRGHSLAEKVAMGLLVLFVLAALSGLFGDGPLSKAAVHSDDGQLHVEYERFCRRNSRQTLEITVPTQRGVDSIELSFNPEYLRKVQVTEIVPQPLEASQQQTSKHRFATDGSGEPMRLRVHVEPQQAAMLHAVLSVGPAGKSAEVRFWQLVYP